MRKELFNGLNWLFQQYQYETEVCVVKLFFQFGYGMKNLTVDLAKRWDGATVILSPRDMAPNQLVRWTNEFEKANVNCYFDPQCYCPKSELKRLTQYSYWDCNLNTNMQAGTTYVEQKIDNIKYYNTIAKTEAYILPCILNKYDDTWENTFLLQQKRFIEAAHRIMTDKPIFATLALPSGLLVQNEKIIEPFLNEIMELNVDGFYIVAEALDKKYLIDSPMWLSNVLHLCATLKIEGKKVIYGYGNHQMLPLALSRVDAIASGTWLNVRSFTNRFVDTDEQKRKSTWVYYPESLSEYKMSFLDWAYNTGYLSTMKSGDKSFMDENYNKLFQSSVAPSATGFNETDAFKHYLCSLRHQIELLDKATYNEAFDSYSIILTTAEREIERLEKNAIFAQARSFKNFIDVTRAAITQLDRSHGFALKMSWNQL